MPEQHPHGVDPPRDRVVSHDLVVFDDGMGAFGPLVDLRAAFELRAGLWSLLERIEVAAGIPAVATVVPARVADIVRESTARPVNAAVVSSDRPVLFVNGRLLDVSVLRGGLPSIGEVVADGSGTVVAAMLSPREAQQALHGAGAGTISWPAAAARRVEARLAAAPWDIVTAVGRTLSEDLAMQAERTPVLGCATRQLRPDEGTSFGTHPLLIHPSARIGPTAVIDVSAGPVVLGPGVVVRPLAVIVGPCVVLDGSTVAERSLLKSGTVIGPHCRAGGEIGGTIFQGYSNKSHDGHLGDSFVGEWVNIGAGTDNSNLLNTYGEVIVRLEPDQGHVRTGRQFWGSIIGDHVKLAIGSRLMTGAVLGTGAMHAASRAVSGTVARFAWCVDGADAPKSFRVEKFLETARAMMARRGKSPSPALESALRMLHARTAGGG